MFKPISGHNFELRIKFISSSYFQMFFEGIYAIGIATSMIEFKVSRQFLTSR